MSTLTKRLIASSVFISISVYAIFSPYEWLFFAIVWLIGILGFNEFLDLAIKKGIPVPRELSLCLGALFPFSVHFSAEPVMFSLACLVLFTFHFSKKIQKDALLGTAVPIFGMVYVVWFLSHLIKIREFPHGPALIFYILLIIKAGDAGAYFTGKKMGKTKLIEHVSPNKSVEGAIGGFITTLVLSVLSKAYLPDLSILHLIILGVAVGVLSQVGDLAESLIKREVGIKDSGVIPGLGGILDVLDSLLLTIPFIYYYLVIYVGLRP